MPIYEFYCPACHALFNFFARTVNTERRPNCPRCKRPKLERQVSAFAMTGRARETEDGPGDLPIDESKMERAIEALAGEAEHLNEDDPRQAAALMRKFSKMTGMEFGDGIEEAIQRMESGEDPEAVEADMGDRMEGEDPFILPGGKGAKGRGERRGPPQRDDALYDL